MELCALNGFFSPAQRQRFLLAVPRRRSVRQYRGAPDAGQIGALHYAAVRSALPGVRIVIGETPADQLYRKLPFVGAIQGTSRYAAVIADENVPHAAIHAGISGEALILEAVAMGLGTCWVAAFKRSGADIPLQPGEKIKAVIALGVPNEQGGPRKRKKLSEICGTDPAGWPLWAYNAAECVRCAPSAVNLQPWRLSYAWHALVLSTARAGADLDMGIAMLHMLLGAGDEPFIMCWEEGKEIASLVAEDGI